MTRIAVLRGDGIGPEVIGAAVETLPSAFQIVDIEAGADRWLSTGEAIGDADIELIRSCDALLFGAVGDARVPDGVLERGVILRLRRELDLYVNLRPFSDLGIDFVRENTEGLYAGAGGITHDTAIESSVNTRSAVTRCVSYAFEHAEQKSRHLTLVHKTNVLRYAGRMWREVFDGVAREFPSVETHYEHVDAAAYHLMRDPGRFSVVVTDNMFGDILTDLAAGLSGGLGKAPSANIHPDPATRRGNCIGMFEPVHGSAPDIAGQNVADPTAAIEAARMLVEMVGKGTDAPARLGSTQRPA